MTVPSGPHASPKKKKLSEQFLCYGDRSVTDKAGYSVLVLLFLLVSTHLLLTHEKAYHYQSEYPNNADSGNRSIQAKEWQNSNNANASNETTFELSVFADSIFYMQKTGKAIRHILYDWYVGDIVQFTVFFYVHSLVWSPILNAKEDAKKLVAINFFGSIILIALFTPMGMLYEWQSIGVQGHLQHIISLGITQLLFIGILLLALNYYLTREGVASQARRTNMQSNNSTRFYFMHRCILLFRCLILTAVILLAKYPNWNNLLHQSLTDVLTIAVISLYAIAFLHTYGKIVIMTATASHVWDKNENGISFKDLSYAIAIVSRYHIGSIILDTTYIPMNILATLSSIILEQYNEGSSNDRVETMAYSKAYATELSRMFTAVLGNNHTENKRSVQHLRKKGHPPLISKSMPTVICFIILKYSVVLLLSSLGIAFMYIAIIASISYVVTAIDTVENTMKFCKIEVEIFSCQYGTVENTNKFYEIEEENVNCKYGHIV